MWEYSRGRFNKSPDDKQSIMQWNLLSQPYRSFKRRSKGRVMHLWGKCWRVSTTTLRTHPENLWYKKRWEHVREKVTNLYENVILYIIVYIQIKVLNVVFDNCIAGVETRLIYRYTCIYYDKYHFFAISSLHRFLYIKQYDTF